MGQGWVESVLVPEPSQHLLEWMLLVNAWSWGLASSTPIEGVGGRVGVSLEVGVRVRTGLLLEFGWYLVCDLFDYDDDEDDDDHYEADEVGIGDHGKGGSGTDQKGVDTC